MIKSISIDKDTEVYIEEIKTHMLSVGDLSKKDLNDSLIIRIAIKKLHERIQK